jgi:GPH family glycoside/pentoside/hexuronide:cation symporter
LEVAEIPPFSAALVLFTAQLADAVLDPVIGRLSDKTRSRIGRRRPWLILCSIPGAIVYILLWQVPGVPGNEYLLYYYIAVTILVTAAHTAVAVPYAALTTELSDDYDERTSLTMWRVGFGVLGGTIAVALQSFLVEALVFEEVDYREGYAIASLVLGAFIGLSPMVSGLFVHETHGLRMAARDASADASGAGLGFFRALRHTFSQRAFAVLAAIYTLSWLAIANVQNTLFLWVKYVLHRESHFALAIVVVQIVAALSLVLWNLLSMRVGKSRAFAMSCAALSVILLLLYWLDESTPLWALYSLTALAGLGLGGAMLLPMAMLPDCVDLDELSSGVRREGDFYGLFVMLQKIGLGVTLAAQSIALGGAGYVNPERQAEASETQPDAVVLVLRLGISAVPALLMLAALALIYFYPLTRDVHRSIRLRLADRDALRDTSDPPAI